MVPIDMPVHLEVGLAIETTVCIRRYAYSLPYSLYIYHIAYHIGYIYIPFSLPYSISRSLKRCDHFCHDITAHLASAIPHMAMYPPFLASLDFWGAIHGYGGYDEALR
jgi:hypothetical protein